MGLRYSATESAQIISAMENNLKVAESLNNQLILGCQSLVAKIDGHLLAGVAYTAGKNLFEDWIIPTIQKVSQVLDDIGANLGAYTLANSGVSAYGIIDEDVLRQEIQLLQERIASNQALMDVNAEATARAYGRGQDSSGYTSGNQVLEHANVFYQSEIDHDIREIEAGYAFQAAVEGLFNNSQSALLSAIQGVTMLNQTFLDEGGNYHLPKGADLSWFNTLENIPLKAKPLTLTEQEDKFIRQAVDNQGLNKTAKSYLRHELSQALKGKSPDQWPNILAGALQVITVDKSGNLIEFETVTRTITGEIDGVPQSATSTGIQVFVNGKENDTVTAQFYATLNREAAAAEAAQQKQNSQDLINGLLGLLHQVDQDTAETTGAAGTLKGIESALIYAGEHSDPQTVAAINQVLKDLGYAAMDLTPVGSVRTIFSGASLPDKALAAASLIPVGKAGEVIQGAEDLIKITKDAKELDQTAKGVKDLQALLSRLDHTENFGEGSLEHVLSGNSQRLSGYHTELFDKSAGTVVKGTESTPNKFGVYEAKVEFNGVPKKGLGGESTFFPKDWSEQKVVDEINTAYENKAYIKGNTYEGTASNGMKIQMFLDKSGKIISAFPEY